MTIDRRPTTTEARSRRAVIAGAIAGLAGLIGGRFARPDPAAAVHLPGFGHANAAGAANTSLTTSSAGTALLVTQNGSGTALRGSAVGPGSIAGFFTANNGTGISGVTGNGGSYGVFAENNGAAGSAGAMRAHGHENHGVVASTTSAVTNAVHGVNTAFVGTAVFGRSTNAGNGVSGIADGDGGYGVTGFGLAGGAVGVYGYTDALVGSGVFGQAAATGLVYGVYGSAATTSGYGVYSSGHAYVEGDLTVTGAITGATKDFRIDHPLDPAQKFLSHSCVESDDRRTVYDGEVTLDAKGEATVTLPAWFGALNRDPRYQLTAIGTAARDLHVKARIANNRFTIAGGEAGQAVSWQVAAVRQDAYARAHPLAVEAAKTGAERGRYLHPDAHGQGASAGIDAGRARPTPADPTHASGPAAGR